MAAAFAESGDASLNAIAKRAGVGAGTLYRHFPTREDLILAVYMWFTRLADYVRVKHRLGEAISRSAAAQQAVNETYAPVTQAVAALLDACVADGSVRSGLDPADVLLLMGFLWRTTPDEAGRGRASRGMEIVITGLSPRG